ncbi:MBL fold metallo-hydrolase [Luteimonas sp. BDR2-5]|uniref:MBL fold metallo-hydrolase n=1 Tax=Proluteimonas luteida TaxID=2878685 RepID=UPI001E368AF4|nr:MBL fold metallo-hydrolase [Luteimonas sp. BDR2-5]MCD9026658.1 MBL fold metallo-hydrolase [Luteimonas sp. BDR2-5]
MRRPLRSAPFLLSVAVLLGLLSAFAPALAADTAPPKITVLYDAFGDDAAPAHGTLEKDWGFAALIEAGGRRILFDTGNDAGVFARNVAAKGIDLADLDMVVMSHRHADHMAGLAVLLAANPGIAIHAPQEGFGIYGSSLPSTFYRKDASLPTRQRYFDGEPAETLHFGSAWPGANLHPIAETTELAPGVWAIATVSDVPGTRELRELSLAVRTPEGLLLVVGCSHPGLPVIVAEAAKLDPDIHLVIGGFHYVNADDAAIADVIAALAPYDIDFIAPGHCTGEPTFAALQRAYGDRYLYAGLGAELVLDRPAGAQRPRGADAALGHAESVAYRALALRGDHAHDHAASHAP